jgi:hypothetical protein
VDSVAPGANSNEKNNGGFLVIFLVDEMIHGKNHWLIAED